MLVLSYCSSCLLVYFGMPSVYGIGIGLVNVVGLANTKINTSLSYQMYSLLFALTPLWILPPPHLPRYPIVIHVYPPTMTFLPPPLPPLHVQQLSPLSSIWIRVYSTGHRFILWTGSDRDEDDDDDDRNAVTYAVILMDGWVVEIYVFCAFSYDRGLIQVSVCGREVEKKL